MVIYPNLLNNGSHHWIWMPLRLFSCHGIIQLFDLKGQFVTAGVVRRMLTLPSFALVPVPYFFQENGKAYLSMKPDMFTEMVSNWHPLPRQSRCRENTQVSSPVYNLESWHILTNLCIFTVHGLLPARHQERLPPRPLPQVVSSAGSSVSWLHEDELIPTRIAKGLPSGNLT